MTAPTRRDVADYLAALTDEELATTLAEARGTSAETHRAFDLSGPTHRGLHTLKGGRTWQD